MSRRRAFVILFATLLTSVLTHALSIRPVVAVGTTYIRADGSADPGCAISCRAVCLNTCIHNNNFTSDSRQTLDYWSYDPNRVSRFASDVRYPSGGSYWSDHNGTDMHSGSFQDVSGRDGIDDVPCPAGDASGGNRPLMDPWPVPWINWLHYHNYTEIVQTLFYLNETYPSIVDVFSIGESWQGRDVYCVRLTNETNTHPKPEVFFTGYHHAREPISEELALYFAVQAATDYGVNETITCMLNYSEIYIVPALNVDGFDAVKNNDWQRKNAHLVDEDHDGLFDEDPPDDEDLDGYIEDLWQWNGSEWVFVRWEGVDDDDDGLLNEDWIGGADLNRNYGYQWNASTQSGSPYPQDEDYRGETPFSELETQATRDLVVQHDFKYAISFHSGAELILYPWGCTNSPPPHEAIFGEIAANLSALVGAPYEQSAQLYTSSGIWDDWMYGNKSVFALTCEIYRNDSAWHYEPGPYTNSWWERGILQAFNPDPSRIETVVQRWLPVFTYITNRAITEAYDVAATNVTPAKTVVGQNYTTEIDVTIMNQGDFTETFNVTVCANSSFIASQPVAVDSKQSLNIAVTWNTSSLAKGNYTISALAGTILGEVDVKDNMLNNSHVIVSMVGDLTGLATDPWDFVPDGVVDGSDLIVMTRSFGSWPEAPPPMKWSSNCDLNDDGVVDGLDILVVARHYGESDP